MSKRRNVETSKHQNVETGEPFGLAHVIVAAAMKCVQDKDPAPYVVVVARDKLHYAHQLWKSIAGGLKAPYGVAVDTLPDMGTNGRLAVLLFSRTGGQ